jgi:hypothetical protein
MPEGGLVELLDAEPAFAAGGANRAAGDGSQAAGEADPARAEAQAAGDAAQAAGDGSQVAGDAEQARAVRTGTRVHFLPDPAVFGDAHVSVAELQRLCAQFDTAADIQVTAD